MRLPPLLERQTDRLDLVYLRALALFRKLNNVPKLNF